MDSIEVAHRLSQVTVKYSGTSDPFIAVRYKAGNCLATALSACALLDDSNQALLMHTVVDTLNRRRGFLHYFAVSLSDKVIVENTNKPHLVKAREVYRYGEGIEAENGQFEKAISLIELVVNGCDTNRLNTRAGHQFEVRINRLDPREVLQGVADGASLTTLEELVLQETSGL
jgi:hypothetical protein